MKRIFHSYAFDAEKALKTGDFGTSDFTRITDYNYFMVNPNTQDYCIPEFTDVSKLVDNQDYYSNLKSHILYFLRYRGNPQKLLLKKNKIYELTSGTQDRTLVSDDFGEEYNICDTCYETYLFIKEEDIEIARKQLELNIKLKKVKNEK